MNIFAMAIASTFNSQRKYLRWHMKPTAFLGVFGALQILLQVVPRPRLYNKD
jgi:hypothetical protein